MTTLFCVAIGAAGRRWVARAVAADAHAQARHARCLPSFSTSAIQPLHAPTADNEKSDSKERYTKNWSSEAPKRTLAKPHPSDLEVLTRALLSGAGDHAPFPARTLPESLVGVTTWPAAIKTGAGDIKQQLEHILSEWSISPQDWLAFRNTLLAQSWPEVRVIMRDVSDEAWPSFILTHAVTLPTTLSEASDALAVLASNVRLSSSTSLEALQAHRQAFQSLSDLVLNELSGLNLVPRLSQTCSDLLASSTSTTYSDRVVSVLAYAANLARHADDRTRQAMLHLLSRFISTEHDAEASSLHHNIVLMCLATEKLGARSRGMSSRSSDQFCNGSFMEKLLLHIPPHHIKTRSWAYRVAITVAGRERQYSQIVGLFDQLLMLQSGTPTVSDLLLYAKALSRTPRGAESALRALEEASQAMSSQTNTAADAGNHHHHPGFRLDLLDIIANNRYIPINSILSMLRIKARDASEGRGRRLPPSLIASVGGVLTTATAYTPIMQGLIRRGEPAMVPKIWRIMLDRQVAPTVAAFSVLLTALFQMGQARIAVQQQDVWLQKGVIMGEAPAHDKQFDLVTIDPTSSHLDDELAVSICGDTLTPHGTRKVLLAADPILASVVFAGLGSSGAQGIELLWPIYCQTVMSFPDSPILRLLLKTTCTSESPSSMLKPRFGRELFRSLLFGKHPELQEYRNPLCAELGAHGPGSWILSGESPEHKIERWLSSFFPETPNQLSASIANTDRLIFNSNLFESYVRLLLHMYHSSQLLSSSSAVKEELLNALGWMKELSICPSDTTLALAVLEIEESLPPPLAVRQMAKIDQWLIDWLGQEQIPSNGFMRKCWAWKMKRNRQGSGWFDPIKFRPRPGQTRDREEHM